MTVRSALIILSLVGNVGLAIVLSRSGPSSSPGDADLHSGQHRRPLDPPVVALNQDTWKTIDRNDDAAFVALLRSQGFPMSTIRTLVRLRIADRFGERQRALRQLQVSRPYWRTNPWMDWRDPEIRAAQRQLDHDIRDAMKAVLGPDVDDPDGPMRAYDRKRLGNLSPEKIEQVKAINADYSELRQQVSELAKGAMLREDREKLAYLDQQERADLAKVMTPEQLAEYDLRTSPSANSVRYRLTYFNATEDEFRAIAKLQLAFDAQYGRANLTNAQDEARRSAEPQLNAQIAAALGPERYADFQITTDGSYRSVDQLVQSLNRPASATRDVIKVKQDVDARATAIRNDASLTPEAQKAQLAALGQEASNRLVLTLGNDGLTAYKRTSGQWLVRLQPAANPPR